MRPFPDLPNVNTLKKYTAGVCKLKYNDCPKFYTWSTYKSTHTTKNKITFFRTYI
jgi:hypothetical protein